MNRANTRTECSNLYSSGRTVWLLAGRRLGNILVETQGRLFIDRMKWQEVEFGLVWFCAVICSDCNKSITFAWLLKINPSKPLRKEKPFFIGVSDNRYHILNYQILHGMINDFLSSFDIERKRERRKERKKKKVYIHCLLESCSRGAES